MTQKQNAFTDPDLIPVFDKVIKNKRLTRDDGLKLYASRDILGIGWLANFVREQKNGNKAYYILNQHLNYSNYCVNQCRFCAYSRKKDEKGGFQLSIKEAVSKVKSALNQPLTEIHIVGGCDPTLDFSYYVNLISSVKGLKPDLVIKAFTMVEIAHMAKKADLSVEDALKRLKEAGLEAIPGGGAEVFSPRVRDALCPEKLDGDGWLKVAEIAHKSGIRSNATMLYGHIETNEEKIDHLIRLRELQDKTGGFIAFIPLHFHPANTNIKGIKGITGIEDLKTIAISRLMLDNFDHIKAYWIMLTPPVAQVALSFGADDIDGTIIEEKISHMAGASTAQALTRAELHTLIKDAGREPVERDTFFNTVKAFKDNGDKEKYRAHGYNNAPDKRISIKEAISLYNEYNLIDLALMAHKKRKAMHPDNMVTYVADRNINYTNICVSGCKFCAFFRPPGDAAGYVLSHEEIAAKIQETLDAGGTQILLQGGMNPDLDLNYFENLFSYIKSNFRIHLHALSPPEIFFLSQKEKIPVEKVLQRLITSGLDSIPGGGAEILVDKIRGQISPNKCGVEAWLEVMKKAHNLGIKTTATMMFGHIENFADRMEHMARIRELHDITGGFTAFIPWTFQPENTSIRVLKASAADYLKTLAISRIFLDNIPNIQASWVTMGDKTGQIALFFGANDMGSTMMEENVVAAAGTTFNLTESELIYLIDKAGFTHKKRYMNYRLVE